MPHPHGPDGGAVDLLLLKPEEVAECLNIGRSKVYELMRAGDLPSVHIGACRRIPRAAVESYLESLTPLIVAP
jgi:excisionase family DNA binding protein